MENRLSGGLAAIAYTVTAFTILFVLAPLAVSVALSVSNTPFVTFPPKGFTLHWYVDVLSDPDFQSSAIFSLELAFFSTLGAMLLGVPAAFGVTRFRFPGRGLVLGLLLTPLVFPILITGLALLQFFSIANMQNSAINLFIAHLLVTLPYVVRTVSASLQLVDRSLEEAARTLGANRWRTFYRATLPQILPGVSAGALFAFMVSLDNFPISMWLSDAQSNPLPILIFQRMSSMFDPSVAVMASLMILVAGIAVLLLERLVGLRRAMGL